MFFKRSLCIHHARELAVVGRLCVRNPLISNTVTLDSHFWNKEEKKKCRHFLFSSLYFANLNNHFKFVIMEGNILMPTHDWSPCRERLRRRLLCRRAEAGPFYFYCQFRGNWEKRRRKSSVMRTIIRIDSNSFFYKTKQLIIIFSTTWMWTVSCPQRVVLITLFCTHKKRKEKEKCCELNYFNNSRKNSFPDSPGSFWVRKNSLITADEVEQRSSRVPKTAIVKDKRAAFTFIVSFFSLKKFDFRNNGRQKSGKINNKFQTRRWD